MSEPQGYLKRVNRDLFKLVDAEGMQTEFFKAIFEDYNPNTRNSVKVLEEVVFEDGQFVSLLQTNEVMLILQNY